ncbi:MAG: hypothetical protein IPM54_27900 [Polyangiaceae bacterium]|nr:hypothetical protein [Polyangiaceae bacterium]
MHVVWLAAEALVLNQPSRRQAGLPLLDAEQDRRARNFFNFFSAIPPPPQVAANPLSQILCIAFPKRAISSSSHVWLGYFRGTAIGIGGAVVVAVGLAVAIGQDGVIVVGLAVAVAVCTMICTVIAEATARTVSASKQGGVATQAASGTAGLPSSMRDSGCASSRSKFSDRWRRRSYWVSERIEAAMHCSSSSSPTVESMSAMVSTSPLLSSVTS